MENKFSTAEIILGGMFTLFIDIISALLDLTGIGWILATVLQSVTSFTTTFWVWSKGSKRATKLERQLMKQLSNILPWVPTCFVAFILEVILHNNPEKFGKLAKLAEK